MCKKWVVKYTSKNGETNRIYSPYEFHVAYVNKNNKSADKQDWQKKNVDIIFLEPGNKTRPYDTHKSGATTQKWVKGTVDSLYATTEEDTKIGRVWKLTDSQGEDVNANNLHEDNNNDYNVLHLFV